MRKLLLLFFLGLCGFANGQSTFVYVDSISITGNKKTKEHIILRELTFTKGDSIPLTTLNATLERSEQLLMNTGMFNGANISFKNWKGSTNEIHLMVNVEETLFIYPVPLFELADRNFNVWWTEQNRSLDRVNIGGDFTHLNFTGRRDKLSLGIKFGYTRKYSARYGLPFINKKRTVGVSTGISFAQNREVNYQTAANKQLFYNEDRFIFQRFSTDIGLAIRPAHKVQHSILLAFSQNWITDVIAKDLNPDFFLKGRSLQRYFALSYTFAYDDRDLRFYPLNGSYFVGTIRKAGLGIFDDRDGLHIEADYRYYHSFSPKWSIRLHGLGKFSLIRSRQPYNDNRAIGFGNRYLHGYEFYLMDGLDMGILKKSLRFRMVENQINFGKLMPIKAFRRMPFKVFMTANSDFGYANDPFEKEANFLNNRMLWGGGIGLDLVFFYDKVLQLEYSFNHLGENGLFLHLNLNI